MNIEKLRTNHLESPIGYLLEPASFSWIVTGQTVPGMETKVVVAADSAFREILFESEWLKVINALDFHPEISLQPQTRYYWKIIAQAAGERLAESDPAWFETAKQQGAWRAKWITPGDASGAAQPILKKQFVIEKEVAAARLYICGLGLYEFEVNGQRTCDEYLLPGYHAYDFWQQYQTFDVTDSLKIGGNALGILLGAGWYKGRFGFDGGYTNLYGEELKLIAELHLAYADGTTETIDSDDSWLTQPGPVLKSSIYDGEVYDARKEVADWSVYTEDLEDWQQVVVLPDATDKLSPRLSPALKYVERLVPQVIQSPTGETILDFGQNMVGWIAFKTQAPAGTELGYEVGEWLQGDCFYNENLRTAEAKFTYISDGTARMVRPHFTFYGFQYAKLIGFDATVDPADFSGYVIHSELEVTGRIETANPKVNQLIKNALWGQKGNFLDVPTDCPQRDERMGWTGDAQIFARTASYNMYTPAFYRKFMHDLRLEQEQLNGSVPFVVPMLKPRDAGAFMGNGAAAWSDAATVIPWVLYEQHGDLSLLEEQYATMVDWVEYVYREDERSGSNRLWTTGFQFGDWLALDGKNPKAPIGGTDPKLVASVYYYYSSTLTAKAAAALGKQADAEKYTALAESIKAALQTEFLTAKGRLAVNTQTAYVLFLNFDLVPQESLSRVIADFEAKLLEDDVHLKTGFVGTPYLCEALTKSGLTELAYSILLNEDYPSWLYAVNLGATTIWERWNSVLPDGKISGTDMNSLNHYAYGSIVEWLYRSVLGIQADPMHAGYRHFFLKPAPSAQLGAASGEYDSSSGKIKSGWRVLEDGQLHFTFEVPSLSTATIELPHCSVDEVTDQLQSLGIAQTEIIQKSDSLSITVAGGAYAFTYKPLKSYKIAYSIAMTYKELLAIKATRTVIFDHLPMLKGNDLALNQLDSSFETFSSIPIVQHFVNDSVLGKINEELAKL